MKKDMLRNQLQLVSCKLKELEDLEKDDAAEAATVETATEELAAMEACIEGTEVQVVSEFAGRGKFGKYGEVVELEGHEALVDFQPGVHRLNADWIAEHEPASKWKKMKNMRELKRPDLLKLLQACGFKHGSPEEEDEDCYLDDVILEKSNGDMLLDSRTVCSLWSPPAAVLCWRHPLSRQLIIQNLMVTVLLPVIVGVGPHSDVVIIRSGSAVHYKTGLSTTVWSNPAVQEGSLLKIKDN